MYLKTNSLRIDQIAEYKILFILRPGDHVMGIEHIDDTLVDLINATK